MYSYNKYEKVAAPPLASKRLFDRVRERIRYLHFSLKINNKYLFYINFFTLVNKKMRHPKEMSVAELEAFLTILANVRQVSPSTHRQALNAILFLYQDVLCLDLPWLAQIGRPPGRKCRVPWRLHCMSNWPPLVLCGRQTGPLGKAVCIRRTLWIPSTRMPFCLGHGSGCFQQPSCRLIRVQVWSGGITL